MTIISRSYVSRQSWWDTWNAFQRTKELSTPWNVIIYRKLLFIPNYNSCKILFGRIACREKVTTAINTIFLLIESVQYRYRLLPVYFSLFPPLLNFPSRFFLIFTFYSAFDIPIRFPFNFHLVPLSPFYPMTFKSSFLFVILRSFFSIFLCRDFFLSFSVFCIRTIG